jgi:hypothetical protein
MDMIAIPAVIVPVGESHVHRETTRIEKQHQHTVSNVAPFSISHFSKRSNLSMAACSIIILSARLKLGPPQTPANGEPYVRRAARPQKTTTDFSIQAHKRDRRAFGSPSRYCLARSPVCYRTPCRRMLLSRGQETKAPARRAGPERLGRWLARRLRGHGTKSSRVEA